MKIKYLTTFKLLLLSLSLAAQNGQPFSLQDAMLYAVENHNSIKKAELGIRDAEQQVVDFRSVGIPKINAEIGYKHYFLIPKMVNTIDEFGPIPLAEPIRMEFPMAQQKNFSAGVTMSTLLVDATYVVGLQAAKAYTDMTNTMLTQQEDQVKSQVVKAYLATLILQENRKLLMSNMLNLDKMITETEALYKNGFSEQLDVDRLSLSRANLDVELANLSRQLDIAYTMLKYSMGYPMEEAVYSTDNIETLMAESAAGGLVGEIPYENRSELKTLLVSEKLNELNIKRLKLGYLPSLSGFANYTFNMQGDSAWTNPDIGLYLPSALVGVTLNIPIFDGFSGKAKIQRAKIDLEEVKLQQEDFKRAVSLQVQNARSNYISAQSRVEHQKKNVDLAKRIFDTTQIKYKEGVGSSIEVTQAEQALYTSQTNYMTMLYELLVAKYDLKTALGEL